MTLDKEAAIVEAILFLESEPVEISRLVKVSKLDKAVVKHALEDLKIKYSQPNSGIELSDIGGGFSLIPHKELWPALKETYGKKSDDKISRAALETLSIIAYSQPLTRGEIESLRGVSVGGVLKLLVEQELIREVGRKEGPGRPVQYGTTREFLKTFHLKSIADLPKLDEEERDRFKLDGED